MNDKQPDNEAQIPKLDLPSKLTPAEIEQRLKPLTRWRLEAGALTRTFHFPNFVEALALTNRIGAIAEAQAHHPDIFLTWGRVELRIWTHDIGGLSEGDFTLAAEIDGLEVDT